VGKMRKKFETLRTERQLTDTRKFCENPTKYQECDAMQYGHLLAIQNKFSLLEDQAWNNSAREISANLSSIDYLVFTDHNPHNRNCGRAWFNWEGCGCPSHASCSWVPGIASVAKKSIDMDLHLILKDFP